MITCGVHRIEYYGEKCPQCAMTLEQAYKVAGEWLDAHSIIFASNPEMRLFVIGLLASYSATQKREIEALEDSVNKAAGAASTETFDFSKFPPEIVEFVRKTGFAWNIWQECEAANGTLIDIEWWLAGAITEATAKLQAGKNEALQLCRDCLNAAKAQGLQLVKQPLDEHDLTTGISEHFEFVNVRAEKLQAEVAALKEKLERIHNDYLGRDAGECLADELAAKVVTNLRADLATERAQNEKLREFLGGSRCGACGTLYRYGCEHGRSQEIKALLSAPVAPAQAPTTKE